jgi:hypothetical protein
MLQLPPSLFYVAGLVLISVLLLVTPNLYSTLLSSPLLLSALPLRPSTHLQVRAMSEGMAQLSTKLSAKEAQLQEGHAQEHQQLQQLLHVLLDSAPLSTQALRELEHSVLERVRAEAPVDSVASVVEQFQAQCKAYRSCPADEAQVTRPPSYTSPFCTILSCYPLSTPFAALLLTPPPPLPAPIPPPCPPLPVLSPHHLLAGAGHECA